MPHLLFLVPHVQLHPNHVMCLLARYNPWLQTSRVTMQNFSYSSLFLFSCKCLCSCISFFCSLQVKKVNTISVYLVYGQACAHTVPAELESACSLALLDGHFRQNERGTYLGVCQQFCGQIVWSDFVCKAFQVLLSSRLQNLHACVCWGLIIAHAFA
jgi:hypothetical protein